MSAAQIVETSEGPADSGRGAFIRGATAVAGVVAVVTLAGCASQPPKPTAQLVRASTLVSQAEKEQAQRYAAADLQRARDELTGAQDAAADHADERARRLAENAAADANLASARAASGKARQSAQQVHRSLDTLKEQLQQSPAPSGEAGPGTGGPGRNRP